MEEYFEMYNDNIEEYYPEENEFRTPEQSSAFWNDFF